MTKESNQRASVVMMGDGRLVVPYSLAFEQRLSATDVRVWMMMRAWYDHNQPVTPEELAEGLQAPIQLVIDSLQMLDVLGWIMLTSDCIPILSVSRLSLDQVVHHNPDYKANLKQYLTESSPRVINVATEMLQRINDTGELDKLSA